MYSQDANRTGRTTWKNGLGLWGTSLAGAEVTEGGSTENEDVAEMVEDVTFEEVPTGSEGIAETVA